jgi:DNA-binding MarR family transcriptional regulator
MNQRTTDPVKRPRGRGLSNADAKPASSPSGSNGAVSPAHGVVEPLTMVVRWTRNRSYERISREAGIAIDRSAITILGNLFRSGPIRLSELATLIGLDRSTVSRQVAAVVAAGYVQRIEDKRDARAALLSLTREGQAIRKKLDDAWHTVAMTLVADWDAEDQLHLGRLLSRVAHRMREDGGL